MAVRVPVTPGSLFNSLAENKTPAGRSYAMQNANVDRGIWEVDKRYISIGSRPGAQANDVCFGLGHGRFACNATHMLAVTGGIPSSGTVELVFNTHTTTALQWDSTAADVQAGLVALVDFEDGEIMCYGGPWPLEPIFATFKGRYADAPQALFTITALSFNTGTVTVSSFVTGGQQEEYLAVVQPNGVGTCTLYSVTSLDGFATTTWTSKATGLTASDWFFQQYADKVYAANQTDGLTWKQLGGAWAGSLGIAGVQNPIVAPSAVPAITDGATDATGTAYGTGYDFSGGATVGNFSGWGTNPTPSFIAGNHVINLVLNAALSGDTVSFTVTLPANADFSHEDLYEILVNTTTTEIVLNEKATQLTLTNADPVELIPPFLDAGSRVDGGTGSTFIRFIHWGSKDRNLRDNVNKINVSMQVTTGTSGKAMQIQIKRLSTWPNDMMDALDMENGATLRAIEYAYTYFKVSTGAESKLSPSKFSSVVPLGAFTWGGHLRVTCTGSPTLLTSDYIKVYRKDRFGLWRFVGRTANVTSGTTIFTDTNMLDELDAFPVYGIVQLPGGFLPNSLGLWKESLVVGADRKVWLSYVGQPLIFAPDPENFAATSTLDTTDPANPRTVFMSDDRSETVLGIVGQDSLYLSGPKTGYAMTNGDTPNDLSPPRRLPGSRGCISSRAAFPQSGGATIAATSGLWYYAVSPGFTGIVATGQIIESEVTKDIRTTWSTIFGSAPTNAVGAIFEEELYIFSGAQYIRFTRNGAILQGTLTDNVKAVFPDQANGFIFATATGRLMRYGDYTTDNGIVVAWSATTGKLDGPRSRIAGIEILYTGQPYLFFEVWDGSGGYDSQRFDIDSEGDGTVNYYPTEILLQGYRYRLTVGGSGGDTVEELAIRVEDADKGGTSGKGN